MSAWFLSVHGRVVLYRGFESVLKSLQVDSTCGWAPFFQIRRMCALVVMGIRQHLEEFLWFLPLSICSCSWWCLWFKWLVRTFLHTITFCMFQLHFWYLNPHPTPTGGFLTQRILRFSFPPSLADLWLLWLSVTLQNSFPHCSTSMPWLPLSPVCHRGVHVRSDHTSCCLPDVALRSFTLGFRYRLKSCWCVMAGLAVDVIDKLWSF